MENVKKMIDDTLEKGKVAPLKSVKLKIKFKDEKRDDKRDDKAEDRKKEIAKKMK